MASTSRVKILDTRSQWYRYYPCHNPEHENCNIVLGSLLRKISSKTHIIMGADVNARVGVMDRPNYSATIGPHGIQGRNDTGARILQLYRE